MNLKEEILGIICVLKENQQGAFHDEKIISIAGKSILIKEEHIDFLYPDEKAAALGESSCILKPSGLTAISGPSSFRKYRILVNSRGYVEEFFINEGDLIF